MYRIVVSVRRLLGRLRAAWRLLRRIVRPDTYRFLTFSAPGHFYSPLPDMRDLRRRDRLIVSRELADLPGVDLFVSNQLELLEQLSIYHRDVPFSDRFDGTHRYYFDNDYFSYGDGVVLYTMLCKLKPERVVEVGSGFSSALMLDTNLQRFNGELDLTFVEPYPTRLHKLLSVDDRQQVRIEQSEVQDVQMAVFEQLKANDVLFIDSSHVVKIGSDVHHLLFEVLPRLNNGVWVHFHDVFWPFEYPENWLLAGRAWNENYMLHAYLMGNPDYKIRFFCDYLADQHAAAYSAALPKATQRPSNPVTYGNSSLWLEVQR